MVRSQHEVEVRLNMLRRENRRSWWGAAFSSTLVITFACSGVKYHLTIVWMPCPEGQNEEDRSSELSKALSRSNALSMIESSVNCIRQGFWNLLLYSLAKNVLRRVFLSPVFWNTIICPFFIQSMDAWKSSCQSTNKQVACESTIRSPFVGFQLWFHKLCSFDAEFRRSWSETVNIVFQISNILTIYISRDLEMSWTRTSSYGSLKSLKLAMPKKRSTAFRQHWHDFSLAAWKEAHLAGCVCFDVAERARTVNSGKTSFPPSVRICCEDALYRFFHSFIHSYIYLIRWRPWPKAMKTI